MKLLFALTILLLSSPAHGDDFWRTWGDGKAEVSEFNLKISRYGEEREGKAILIFVTENFSKESFVKSDSGVPVMKMNLLKTFNTGVYQYRIMQSLFQDLETGDILKNSFSSQEWCGQVYAQMLRKNGKYDYTSHSYFEGEADQAGTLEGGFLEDGFLLLAKGFLGHGLKPGESKTLSALESLQRVRLDHKPAKAHETRISRKEAPFDNSIYKLENSGGWMEVTIKEGKIVSWKSSDGEEAELVKNKRIAYWEKNGLGDEW